MQTPAPSPRHTQVSLAVTSAALFAALSSVTSSFGSVSFTPEASAANKGISAEFLSVPVWLKAAGNNSSPSFFHREPELQGWSCVQHWVFGSQSSAGLGAEAHPSAQGAAFTPDLSDSPCPCAVSPLKPLQLPLDAFGKSGLTNSSKFGASAKY